MEHILLVREWASAGYAGLELRERWESIDTPNVYHDYSYKTRKRTNHETRINGIKIYSQCDTNEAPAERKLYGLRVTLPAGSDIHWHNLDEAENDIARMKKILKGYQALTEKFGKPKGFVQFVTYVADVIDTKLAVYCADHVQDLSIYGLETLERKVLGLE